MIATDRLMLRGWRDGDGAAFVAATNTPAVMVHLGGVRDPGAMLGAVARQQALEAAHGFCFWIVERRTDGELLGFCGLEPSGLTGTPVDDDIEIGWRLREDAWGQGYALEAARASLAWGWANLAVPRIVAMTIPANRPSRRLMERLGMVWRPELDFGHPGIPPDRPHHSHIVYALNRPG